MDLNRCIRKIPNYPTEGILFFDITGILVNPDAYSYCINRMLEIYKDVKIDAVAGIESRGFLFAAPFAERCGIPLILIRKSGKLPGETYSQRYELEYGTAEIEVHKSDVRPGQNILLIDDLIATGGTLRASRKILERGGAHLNRIFGIISLPFLKFQDKLPGIQIDTLISFENDSVEPAS